MSSFFEASGIEGWCRSADQKLKEAFEGARSRATVTPVDCQSALDWDPPYCRICECYPDGAIPDDDPLSIDRPRQVAFPACSVGGAVGGSGPT
jgi:hypothetical protein